MKDIPAVEIMKTLAEIHEEIDPFLNRLIPWKIMKENPRQILHGKKRAFLTFVMKVEDLDQIGVGKTGKELDLFLKKLKEPRTEIRMEKFQGDRLAPLAIIGLKDPPHSPFAEQFLKAVAAEIFFNNVHSLRLPLNGFETYFEPQDWESQVKVFKKFKLKTL
jgi:hypothetical protein